MNCFYWACDSALGDLLFSKIRIKVEYISLQNNEITNNAAWVIRGID